MRCLMPARTTGKFLLERLDAYLSAEMGLVGRRPFFAHFFQLEQIFCYNVYQKGTYIYACCNGTDKQYEHGGEIRHA